MTKHVYSPIVLVCTLSTPCEGNERTLPSQDKQLEKNILGIR